MRKMLYFDVEWANPKNKSICQLGLVSEDFETGDPVYPELNLYVNPEDNFDINCVAVHKITEAMVKQCPSFDKIWPDIQNYFTNSIIVGHNVKSSDLNALIKNLQRYNLEIPELWCIDTYSLARNHVSNLYVKDYKLSTLCDFFGIDIDNEHDAFDDACACADLLKALVENYNLDLDEIVERYDTEDIDNIFYPYVSSVEFKREVNTLYGVISGIQLDEVVVEKEMQFLIDWKNKHKGYIRYDDVRKIILVLNDILQDGIVTVDELNRLKSCLFDYLRYTNSSRETIATQRLQGIITGIIADEEIKEIEVQKLQNWLYHNDYLEGHYPYDRVLKLVSEVLEDGIITSYEKRDLLALFEEMTDPLKKIHKSLVVFKDKHFVLSGEFNYGAKKKVEEYIISKGGFIDKSVVKRTNYVVVGEFGSAAYSNGTYGTKVKKAMEMNIPVLKEMQLFLCGD